MPWYGSGMAIRVGMHEAKTHFSKLVERARAGEEIVVQRSGTPVAKIVAYEEKPRSILDARGALRGRIWMADDFDELPEDVARALGMID